MDTQLTEEAKLLEELLEYSSFNCGNYLEVHMEKYVIPQNWNYDFKFPAFLSCLG